MKIFLKRFLVTVFWLISFETLTAQEQSIQSLINIKELRPGQALELEILYDTTNSEKTAGLGLRLHFNSEAVDLEELTSRLNEGALPFQIQNDTRNFDNNDGTDKYFLTPWADTSGQGWPSNSELPVTLYSLPVKATESFNATTLAFSAYTAVGYTLDASNIVIPLAIKPVISLLGQTEVNLELGTAYADAGATALDNIDGDITSSIRVVSDVDIYKVGLYSVTYNVSDAAGNPADEIARVVNITPDVTKPVITMLGGDIDHEQGTPYMDLGATAFDNIDGDITSFITVENNVDPDTAGTYTVVYSVSDSSNNAAETRTRTVTVLDTTRPIITIVGGDIDHEQGAPYADPGATAIDNIDGDITSSITVENNVDPDTAGTYTVVYSVSDISGNAAEQGVRTVVVSDTTKPIISLIGASDVDVLVNDLYVDEGASAFDNIDGDITNQIVIINPVDTSQVGDYIVSYNVEDSSGNKALEVTRSIYVGGTLDIDGNGNYDALTDGLLILRYMFGLDGESLVLGTVASDATLKTSNEIEAQIQSIFSLLDIDDNSNVDPLTDGLLVVRYLFELRGDTLILGVIANDANRRTSNEIESFLEELTP